MHKALPQSISPAGSNTPWIDGTPFAANHFLKLADNIESYLGTAVTQVQALLQEELDDLTQSVPEWQPYEGKVKVEWHKDSFQYFFEGTPKEIAAMKDMEYGFGEAPVNSVTRKVAIRMEDRAGKLLSQILNKEAGYER
jgi:hypothetical protein